MIVDDVGGWNCDHVSEEANDAVDTGVGSASSGASHKPSLLDLRHLGGSSNHWVL